MPHGIDRIFLFILLQCSVTCCIIVFNVFLNKQHPVLSIKRKFNDMKNTYKIPRIWLQDITAKFSHMESVFQGHEACKN